MIRIIWLRFIETPCGTRSDEVTLNEDELKLHPEQFSYIPMSENTYMSTQFKPGTVVQLKVGGPKMIISNKGTCVWSSADGKPQEKKFDACVLQEVDTDKEEFRKSRSNRTTVTVCTSVNKLLDESPISADNPASFMGKLEDFLKTNHSDLWSIVFDGTKYVRSSYAVGTLIKHPNEKPVWILAPSGV